MSKETIPKKVKQQQIRNIVIVGAVVMLGSWGLAARRRAIGSPVAG